MFYLETPENESDCRFVPLPSTTASRQENPLSSFFFYPLFMSPVALDQDPRKANPTPRSGGRVTARPVFARSFFFAESDPAVLLSCQIFLHAQQIALAGTLNNPQQLSHRGDLLQLLLNEPLKKIVGRIIGLSLCHGHKRIDLGCDLLFLFERKLYRVFGDFEMRLWRGHRAGIFTRAPVSMTNWIKRSACS